MIAPCTPPSWLPLCLLPLAGCFIATPLRDSEGLEDGPEGQVVPAEDDADTGAFADLRWGVSGTLVIVGDQPDAGASRLKLETRGVDCGVAATLESATALAGPPLGVVEGWTLQVVAEAADACTWRGPTTFVVGFGASDPQLRPAADRAGIAWDGTSGLYLGAPGDPLFLVGLAQPVEADTGSSTDTGPSADTGSSADTEAPSRAFDLTTLHGIPLDR